jgi:hypothetical protein
MDQRPVDRAQIQERLAAEINMMPSTRQFVSVGLLFILLVTIAEWVASIQAGQTAAALQAGFPQPIGNPWKGTSVRNFHYYATINAITVSIILLIPAIGAFILRRAHGPGPGWLMFWTAANLAFLLHLYHGIHGVFADHWNWIFHDQPNLDAGKPPRVTNPYGDALIAVWWTLDVIMAWTASNRPRWIRAERGILHLVLFVSALVSSIVLSSNGYVRGWGITLLILTALCGIYRVVVYPFDPTLLAGRLYIWTYQAINRVLPWYRLSTWPAVLNLGALRIIMRKYNLHDTSTIPISNPGGVAPMPPFESRFLTERHVDGYFNDLNNPRMGSASLPDADHRDSVYFTQSNPGARFGRNVPLADAFPECMPQLMQPSPQLISQELLARRKFLPATSLNLIAAAWIQFEVHDWFNHGEPITEDPWAVPLPEGDSWRQHGCPMHIRRTRPDPTRDYAKERAANGGRLQYPPTYANAESHWWDGSQIYGSDPGTTRRLRAEYELHDGRMVPTGRLLPGGKLFLDHQNLLLDPDHMGVALSGFVGTWWAGLSLLHTLFAREHNAICEQLKVEYPYWDDERLFATARMINAALMAKIHTVEWTPAILAHPVLQIAMNANWWGLETERLYRAIGRISENEAFSGIPLSGVDHSGADYCLTEEFVSVYRMHPLMPDELEVRSAVTGQPLKTFKMMEGVVGNLQDLTVFGEGRTMADVLYSFGVSHPGAITIHNFPNFLRELKRPDGEVIDLASVDVMRDRERGVPRYNRFRELLHKKPIRSFDELAHRDHPGLPEELRRIYGQTDGRDNVDRIDLMVGLFSEEPPPGFGFSDTAFRIFVLMASRRLKSDRFIADHFIPEVYTELGIDWVNSNSMISVIRRHFPELAPALLGVANAFQPWRDLAASAAASAARANA